MKIKKLIPLFLILVLSIQLLPLQRIAAWLSSGQVTEEMAHGLDESKAKPQPFGNDPAFLLQVIAVNRRLSTPFLNKFHGDESLFNRHADEILTPPPNE
jgi:hypothetical protein